MLLLAPDLLGESLALKLTSAREDWEVVLRPERLTGAPALVIWSIDTVASLASLQQELFALQERWQPAPVLLLLPSELRLSREQLLELPAAGRGGLGLETPISRCVPWPFGRQGSPGPPSRPAPTSSSSPAPAGSGIRAASS